MQCETVDNTCQSTNNLNLGLQFPESSIYYSRSLSNLSHYLFIFLIITLLLTYDGPNQAFELDEMFKEWFAMDNPQ